MQRKGTRKPNNAIITTNSTSTKQAEQQEDVIIEDAIEVPKKPDTTFREFYLNIFSGIKILFIFFLLSPWIATISIKVKESEYLPKLQKLLEESFTCPKMKIQNCTCEAPVQDLNSPIGDNNQSPKI